MKYKYDITETKVNPKTPIQDAATGAVIEVDMLISHFSDEDGKPVGGACYMFEESGNIKLLQYIGYNKND